MHRAIVVLVLLTCLTSQTSTTSCPSIAAMPDFNIDGILGRWYTIQETDATARCISADITVVDFARGIYELDETSPSKGLANTLGLRHDHHVKYKLQIPDASMPAIMDLSLPLLASYKLTVLDTDYDNYAAFVLCNKRISLLRSKTVISILSRRPTIEARHLERVYAKLLEHSINPFTVEMVNQQRCPERGEKGVILKAASDIFDTVKGAVSDILHPKHHEKKPDPSVTGEFQIDVRLSD